MRKIPHEQSQHTSPTKPIFADTSKSASIPKRTDRFIKSWKLDYVPGFDLTSSQHSESDHFFRSLKFPSTSISDFSELDLSTLAYPSASSYRYLPLQASRILDAPEMVDDFYLNILDWSDSNIIAVALYNKLYLWNANTKSVHELLEYESEIITSVAWMKGSSALAVGDSSHNLKLFDMEKHSEIRTIKQHTDRVSSLAWNGCILSSGSRDSSIIEHDLRIQQYFVKYNRHTQEVCGLKWNEEGNQLASGSNDNKICIWELGSTEPLLDVNAHFSAVKALAWCPWKPYSLASGGGTSDRTIKVWNTLNGEVLSSVDTGSEVSAIEWNKHEKEIVSAHGYPNNELSIWRCPGMKKVGDLVGHNGRVLSMAQNWEGSTVVTASADETIRFWDVFESSIDIGKKSPGTPSRSMQTFYR